MGVRGMENTTPGQVTLKIFNKHRMCERLYAGWSLTEV